MLRHPRPHVRAAALVALAALLAGCGIKGPLTAPPAAEAATATPADEAQRRAAKPAPTL